MILTLNLIMRFSRGLPLTNKSHRRIYGDSIKQGLGETSQVLHKYLEYIKKGKLNPLTYLKKENFIKTMQLYWGIL